MKVHVVDGTFELFRSYFGTPRSGLVRGREVGATRGLLSTLMALLRERDVTHVAVAFDNVIESFRNRLFEGYKTGEGVQPELRAQFELAERAAAALGLVVWPMRDFEADDALATGAARFKDAPGVEQVVICSPDKDLAQCVEGTRVVYRDRMRNVTRDEKAVIAKFGVSPRSIPDWLALVGDTADGIPGIPGWGAKSSAAVLARYGTIASIPDAESDWDVSVRSRARLAAALCERREDAMLYRELATLRTDVPLTESLDALRWQGAHRKPLESLCAEIGTEEVLGRVPRWRAD